MELVHVLMRQEPLVCFIRWISRWISLEYLCVGNCNDEMIEIEISYMMTLRNDEPTLLNTSDFVLQNHQVPEGGVHNPDVRHHGVLRLHSSLSNR